MTFPVWKFPDLKKGRVEGSNLSKFLKLSEWTLKYLILTFGKKQNYIPKKDNSKQQTHTIYSFFQQKNGKKTPSTLDSPFWLVEIF